MKQDKGIHETVNKVITDCVVKCKQPYSYFESWCKTNRLGAASVSRLNIDIGVLPTVIRLAQASDLK